MIKPIETAYKGYRFRSRLEARWAVYFDAIGLQWEYEKEGYDLGDGFFYLPDFWLPQVNMWAEVKPGDFSPESLEKIKRLVIGTGFSCILLDGLPGLKPYLYISNDWVDPEGNLVMDEGNDCMISMYHDYPTQEARFYSCVGVDRNEMSYEDWFDRNCCFDDVPAAVQAALSARFEHGENG